MYISANQFLIHVFIPRCIYHLLFVFPSTIRLWNYFPQHNNYGKSE